MTPSHASTEPKRPSAASIEQLLAGRWWYHKMELGGGQRTPGKYGDNLIPVAHLLRHVDLAGQRCLDIGVMDAKMSFLMESLGGNVVAADGLARDTVPDLIEAFGSTVRYRTGIVVETIPDLLASEGTFDFVLCAGVAYHVFSPFDLIANVRALLRTGGLAIFETAALPDDEHLTMVLNRGDHYNEYTTLWIPSTACFRYMLRFLSMRILGESRVSTGHHVVRHAWLVQADKPSVLATESSDPWLTTLLGRQAPGLSHEHLGKQLDHEYLEGLPQSTITATPVTENRFFNLDEPSSYQAESELLSRGTPAWRLVGSAQS